MANKSVSNGEYIDVFIEPPQPIRLKLSKHAFSTLLKIGARGLAVIISDEEWGPVVRYYYLKRSRLINSMLENKAFPAELSIIGKHAEELILKDGTKVLIWPFKTKSGDRYIVNYIVLEVGDNINKSELKKILKEISIRLEKNSADDPKFVNKLLKLVLEKRKKSA